jgi:hypothetical protein
MPLMDLMLARKEPKVKSICRTCTPCWQRCGRPNKCPHHPRQFIFLIDLTSQEGSAMNISDTKATLSFSDGSPAVECRSTRARSARTSSTSASCTPDRQVHLRPGLHVDRGVQLVDHLHRRRQGRTAVSRLPDRAAGGQRDFLETCYLLLNGELPNAAAEGRVRRHRDQAHDGARADAILLPRLPPRRAPDVGAGGHRRRAGVVLPRLARHQRSASTAKCRRSA